MGPKGLDKMGVFSKLNLQSAKPGAGGVYFLPGHYVAEVDAIKVVDTRKGGALFVAECKILESDNEDRKAGRRCSWAMSMDKDAAAGNIKAFLGACIGRDPRDEASLEAPDSDGKPVDWDSIAELAVADEQPMKGTKIEIEAVSRLKKGGDPTKPTDYYTLCNFSAHTPMVEL